MTTDHYARAVELDEAAAVVHTPERALVHATRALTHAILATRPEPLEPAVSIVGAVDAAACPTHGLDELRAVLREHLPHDTAAAAVDDAACAVWREGYRPTWTGATL